MTHEEVAWLATELGADVTVGATSPPPPREGLVGTCPLVVDRISGRFRISRPDFRSEGMSRRGVTVDHATDHRLRTFLARIATLQARERAIADAGIQAPPYPAWAFATDPIAIAIARSDGIDLAQATRPATWRRTIDPMFGSLATHADTWQWSRENAHVRGSPPDGRPEGGFEAWMIGERLRFGVFASRSMPITLREEGAATKLFVKASPPDAALAAMKGRPLREIVEGLDVDHVVTGATRDGEWMSLRMRGKRVPLAPPPPGADVSWMDV